MNLTARKYTLKIFNLIAESLHLKYSKKSPELLQHWIEDEIGSVPFIALVNMTSTVNGQFIVFNCRFVSSTTLEFDPTDEEKEEAEERAEAQAMSFVRMVEEVPAVELSNISVTETFRDQTFEGVGKGLSFDFSVLDVQNYCEDNIPNFNDLLCP